MNYLSEWKLLQTKDLPLLLEHMWPFMMMMIPGRRIFYRKLSPFWKKNKSYAGVITYTNKIEEEITTNEILLKNRHLFNNISQLSFECIFRTNLFPPIAFIYKRDVFSVIGTYDESFLVLGDWDFNLRFLKKYTIGIIPLPLANYHIRLTQKNMSAGNSIGAGKSLHLNHVEKINYKYFIPDLQQGAPSFCIILQSVLRNVPGFSLTDFLDMLLWCENHTTVPRSVFLSIFLKEGFQSPLCLKDKLKLSIALILGTVWIDRIHAFIHLPKYPPLQHTP